MENRLKLLRKKKKLTQREAADYLRMPLLKYKKAERQPFSGDSIKQRITIKRLSALNPVDETHGILSTDDILNICEDVFKEYPVSFAYLFGAYANGSAREYSSVEMLIGMKTIGIPFDSLKKDLCDSLHKRVVVFSIDQLKDNEALLNKVLRDGLKVYGPEKTMRK